MSAPVTHLLEPLQVGKYTLKNRIVMAPLTRCRADDNHVPTPMMARHYADRASAGLIIAEATMVKPGYSSFGYEPGIYSEEQIGAWKRVTDAVHAQGGLIFLQLHHGGRATVQSNLAEGLVVEASSDTPVTLHRFPAFFNRAGVDEPFTAPKELTDTEIEDRMQLFVQAAKNAMQAGFDGVEIHGGGGYLLDGFWRKSATTRGAPYGGDVDHRCNVMVQTTEAVCSAIGADKVGLRITPLLTYNGMADDEAEALVKRLCVRLNPSHLAFLHVMRGDRFSDVPMAASAWAREAYEGVLISNLVYTPAEAEAAVASKAVDAVAFGVDFIANADLVERLTTGALLNTPKEDFFYDHSAGEKGYNDYPLLPSTEARCTRL